MHEIQIFTDLSLLFTVAVFFAWVFGRMGLPPVLAYVLTGTVLGPFGLGWVERGEELQLVAEIGVILLLFTVGLEFSLSEVRRSWKSVLVGGGLQVLGTIAVILGLAVISGRSTSIGLTWGFLVALSSTAVILRQLESRGESKAAHGRLVIGVLIFQDLAVVPMMLLLPLLAGEGGGLVSIGAVFAKAIVIIIVTILLSQKIAPWLLKQIARSRNREMFLLAVLAVAGITAWITSLTGLSLALGAFLAGMVLADSEYSHQAFAEVLPIRAVMMCVFFVTIGMLLDIQLVVQNPGAVIGLFVLLIVVKFVVAWIAAMFLRFPVKIAALAAAALAQVGEFSFVLAGHAAELKLLSSEESRIFLAASVLSIATAPLAVSLFPRFLAGTRALAPLEGLLDPGATKPESYSTEAKGHVIVAGLGIGGRTVVDALEDAGIPVVIIELNPDTVVRERRAGRRIVYGDVAAPEVLEHAGIHRARALCLVTSQPEATQRALEVARQLRQDLPIVVRTRFARDEGMERQAHVHVVSEEFSGAAAIAGTLLRSCKIEHWPEIIDKIVAEHDQLPPGEEGSLGPPPVGHVARSRSENLTA